MYRYSGWPLGLASSLLVVQRAPEQRRLLETVLSNRTFDRGSLVRLTEAVRLFMKGNKSGELAERVGFEPTVEFPLHTLSKRAQSTTLTSLRLESTVCGRPRTV